MQPMLKKKPKQTKPILDPERFKAALDAANAPRGRNRTAWVAETFGVSQQMALRWIHGDSFPVRYERDICQRLNINSGWLRDGTGPMHAVAGVNDPAALYQASAPGNDLIDPEIYGARLAWQAFVHRGGGYITAGDLQADDIDALDRIMRQLANAGARRRARD